MKVRKLLLLSFLAVAVISCFAQEDREKKVRPHSVNTIGLIEGEAGSAFSLQTINGIQYKSFFGGVGIGIDLYKYRTIPLFIDLRKTIGKANNKFFVFGDAGINFYWERDNDVKQFPLKDEFKDGFYGGAGTGYKLKLKQNSYFLFSAEYSYKKLTETGVGYGDSSPERIRYNLNRLILKAGIEF